MTLASSEKNPTKSFVRGDWSRGLNQNVPDLNPTSCSFGFRDPTCYEAPNNSRVELLENTIISIRLVRLSPQKWPKVARGTAK